MQLGIVFSLTLSVSVPSGPSVEGIQKNEGIAKEYILIPTHP